MLNFLATGLLTASATLACECPAQACCGPCGCAMMHAASPVPAPNALANPHAGMQMSQGGGSRTYQSFSYEPAEPGVAAQLQPIAAPRYRMMPTMPSVRQNAAATGKFR